MKIEQKILDSLEKYFNATLIGSSLFGLPQENVNKIDLLF